MSEQEEQGKRIDSQAWLQAAIEAIEDSIEVPSESLPLLAISYAVLLLDAHKAIEAKLPMSEWPESMIRYRVMVMSRLHPEVKLTLTGNDVFAEVESKENS